MNYQKPKNKKIKKKDKIKMVTYIDGPFFASTTQTKKERQKELRNQVYQCMVERSKNSNIEYIKYIKKVDIQI